MHLAISQIFALFCFFVLAFALLAKRKLHLRPLYAFSFFFIVQYGPHSVIYTENFWYAADLGDYVHSIYSAIVGVVYLMLGCVVGLRVPGPRAKVTSPFSLKAGYSVTFPTAAFLCFALCATVIISLALSAKQSIIATNLSFLLGTSVFSYSELRRELFVDSGWFKFAAAIRFSLLPILVTSVYAVLIRRGRSYSGFAVLFICVIIAAVQLNKFFYIYYLMLFSLVGYSLRAQALPSIDLGRINSKLLSALVAASVVVWAIYRLYLIQYSEAIESGYINASRISSTLVYRAFYASADALHLWIDYFLFRDDPKGLSVIGRVCATGLVECFDANARIPQIYLGEYQTTLQVGFIGTGLAMGGVFGAILVSVLTIFILLILDLEAARSMRRGSGAVIVPLMCLASFFMTTRDLHTAVLSGGLLFIFLYSRIINKKRASTL